MFGENSKENRLWRMDAAQECFPSQIFYVFFGISPDIYFFPTLDGCFLVLFISS